MSPATKQAAAPAAKAKRGRKPASGKTAAAAKTAAAKTDAAPAAKADTAAKTAAATAPKAAPAKTAAKKAAPKKTTGARRGRVASGIAKKQKTFNLPISTIGALQKFAKKNKLSDSALADAALLAYMDAGAPAKPAEASVDAAALQAQIDERDARIAQLEAELAAVVADAQEAQAEAAVDGITEVLALAHVESATDQDMNAAIETIDKQAEQIDSLIHILEASTALQVSLAQRM